MDIVKICKKHGELTSKDIGTRCKGKYYDCLICRRFWKKTNYLKNRDKEIERSKEWKEKNIERHKENVKKWRSSEKGKEAYKRHYLKHRERLLKSAREWEKNNPEKYKKIKTITYYKNKENITDSYIVHILNLKNISSKEIPKEFFEVKRAHIKLKRKIKEKINGNK